MESGRNWGWQIQGFLDEQTAYQRDPSDLLAWGFTANKDQCWDSSLGLFIPSTLLILSCDSQLCVEGSLLKSLVSPGNLASIHYILVANALFPDCSLAQDMCRSSRRHVAMRVDIWGRGKEVTQGVKIKMYSSSIFWTTGLHGALWGRDALKRNTKAIQLWLYSLCSVFLQHWASRPFRLALFLFPWVLCHSPVSQWNSFTWHRGMKYLRGSWHPIGRRCSCRQKWPRDPLCSYAAERTYSNESKP